MNDAAQTQTHHFTSYDGWRLRYQVTGRGPTMVLVNGFVCSTQYWPEVIDRFRSHYTVVSWDYRAHGGQPVPPTMEAITLEGFARDLEALLEHLDAGPVIVVGHSMGVQVSLEHHRRRADQVRALVLVCGTYQNPMATLPQADRFQRLTLGLTGQLRRRSRVRGAVERSLKPLLRTRLATEIAFVVGGANRELCPPHYLEELFAHVQALDARVLLASFESMVRHSAFDVLAKVGVPTLILSGERDDMAPPERSREMHQAIAGADCHIYPECTHLAMLEKPDQVLGDLEAFLARLEG